MLDVSLVADGTAHVALHRDGPVVSRVVAGCWRLVTQTAGSVHAAASFVADCLEAGVTTFDLANVYGGFQAETLFADALRQFGNDRSQVQLVTKCGVAPVHPARPGHRILHYDNSGAHVRREVEASLSALRAERIDLLLVHRPDPLMEPLALAETLAKLIDEQKIGAVGVSNFAPRQLDLLAAGLGIPVATNQIEFSLLRPDAIWDGRLLQAQQLGFRPMAWSPLGGGKLFLEDPATFALREALARLAKTYGHSVPTIALAWILRHPAGIVPVFGGMGPDRLRAAVDALSIDLDRQDWYDLYVAAGGEVV